MFSGNPSGVHPGVGLPTSNFQAAMAGKSAYEKYAGGVNKSTVLGAGGFSGITGGLLLNKDGSGTDRSTYHPLHNPMHGVAPKEEKFFTSPGGSGSNPAG